MGGPQREWRRWEQSIQPRFEGWLASNKSLRYPISICYSVRIGLLVIVSPACNL
jgi:hypothetical protein